MLPRMVRLPGDPHRLARALAAGQVRRPSIRIGPSAAAIVGVSLVIALVAGAVLLAQITGQIRRDADARMDADAASATRDLAGAMASATDDLRLARRSSVFETALADTSGQLLSADRPGVEAAISYLGERYDVDEICLIRSSGLEAARWVRTSGLAPVDDLSPDERQNNPAVLPALRLADDATYETEPYVSPDSERWVIGIATPIVEPDGATTGVLHAEIPIASMADQLASLPPSGEGFGILLDRDGRLLVHPDLATFRTTAGLSADPDGAPFPLATVAGSESWRSAVSRMVSGSAGSVTYEDSGRTFRLSFVPVPGSSRILGLVEPTDSLYADVNRTIFNVAATVAPLLLLMAVVTIWFTRRMTRANRSLTRLNQRLSTANADLEGASRMSAEIARESAILNRFTELTALTEDDVSLSEATLATLDELVHPTDGSLHVSNQSQDRAIPQAALGGGPDRVLSLHELARCPAIRRSSLFVTDQIAHRLAFKCPVYPVTTGTLACVPLVALGETVGAIHLHWEDGRELSLESRLAITRISEHSALSIANRRLLLALRGQANTDGRTGLTNSRAFDEIVERRLASRGSDGRAAVLMLDLDHFKDFNDRFGHPGGDEALRAFAHLLAASVRDGDVAARYGGEEFALFLDGLDGPAAAEIAERIRARAEATIIALGPGKTGRITVSIGVATTPGHGSDRASLLRSADAALYQAKLGGRNRVVVAGAPGPAARPDRRRAPRTRRSAA
jgi:diguanylate cyclase (GGDEF)-like protein